MIRHRLIYSTMVAVGLLAVAPAWHARAASVQESALAAWHGRIGANLSYSRSGRALSPGRYKVQYIAVHKVSVKWFTSLQKALLFAKGREDAAVFDNQSGQVLYTDMRRRYALTVYSASGTPTSTVDFATLDAAIAAAVGSQSAVVRDRLTGATVWSVANNYVVALPSSQISYQTLSAAMGAASAAPTSRIFAMPTNLTVWQSTYDVMVNGSFIKSFATFTNAQTFANQSAQSQVMDTVTGKDVWDNIPRYNVYQNGILVKQFAYESDAVTFAQGLTNVTVVEIANQQTVYTDVPKYDVEVGAQVNKGFVNLSDAIAYAKTIPGAVVVNIATNQVVWTATDTFGVFRYLELVRAFSSMPDAIAYAKTLDHVQVIDTQNNQVEFSNYPTTVKSPYGDTFTVENGMVVDHWGKLNVTLAPAPSFMVPGQVYVSNDYSHWYEVQPNGDVYVGQWVNPYQTMNIETQSTLTAAEINQFIAANAISSSVLQGTGAYFIEAQNAYGVNAQYLVAHAIIESAWGTSYFARNRNNLFGYEAYTSNPNAAAIFRSVEYDINFQAWFVRNDYLDPNGSFYNGANLNGMNVDYATDPYWANSIARVMAEMMPYSQAIANESVIGETPNRKVFLYPAGAVGQATKALTVYNVPADSATVAAQAVGSIPKGTDFTVLGDCPGWDQVKLPQGGTGYVNWNNVSLQNMGAVYGINSGSTLDIRSTATASSSTNVIAQLSNGTYLLIVKSGPNGWDYVELANGNKGWTVSQYIRIVH